MVSRGVYDPMWLSLFLALLYQSMQKLCIPTKAANYHKLKINNMLHYKKKNMLHLPMLAIACQSTCFRLLQTI